METHSWVFPEYCLTNSIEHNVEADEVEIATDLNQAAGEVVAILDDSKLSISQLQPDQLAELNLYYVAVSRAKKSLLNATLLS